MNDSKKIEQVVFDTLKLSEFNFGDPEAKTDTVLEHCSLTIRGVQEFLGGSKSIVLGERGAGKSALFKLVSNGKYNFPSDSQEKKRIRKQLIVAIDDDFEYQNIANVVDERFENHGKKKLGKYRLFWEICILGKTVVRLTEEDADDTELKELIKDLQVVLGVSVSEGFTISSFLSSLKLSGGVKFDPSGSITPSVSIESAKSNLGSDRKINDHEIIAIRERIFKYLKSKNIIVTVLVDKIDDFVVGFDYENQKLNVQSLLECVHFYNHPYFKLKIFLRADLFERMNFETTGYDKISPKVVRLSWTKEEIKEFVAKRLHYNFKKCGIDIKYRSASGELLDVAPYLKDQVRDLFRNKPTSLKGLLSLIGKAIILTSKIRWHIFRKSPRSARQTNLDDDIYLAVITSIFPSKVRHKNAVCKDEEVSIGDFLATHFMLGGFTPNPRLVLLFLQHVIEESVAYYSKNSDKKLIPQNEIYEYEVILKDHVSIGYKKTQEIARKTISRLNHEWRPYVDRLFAATYQPKNCKGLSLDKIRACVAWDRKEQEFERFIAFFSHVGLLVSDNPSAKLKDRFFSLPLILQVCP